ncbi:MAG: MarR family transcriptional regulator [Erysipelothrix sp.]|nr:MarR family transcriptional regulator [Erysipelothrix sp.]
MNKETEYKLTEDLFSTLEQFRCVDKGANRKSGLGGKPVSMLMMIGQLTKQGPVPVSELKKYMHISAPAITQFVNILHFKGYVQKFSDPMDKRKSLIALSEKGEKELKKAMEKLKVHMGLMVRHLGENDTRTLNEILSKIVKFYMMEQGENDE